MVELKITDASCCKLNTTPLKPWLVGGALLLQNRTSGVWRNNTPFFLDSGAGQRIIIPIKFGAFTEMGKIDMWEIEKNFKVKIGGKYFINCESLISYHDKPLFTIKRRESDGRLGTDFDVYGKNGQKVATIRRGKVVEGDIKAYDIQHGADCHKVIEKTTGRIIVQIDREAPEAELAVSVNMYLPDGFLLEATPDSINIGPSMMVNNIFGGLKTAIAIGDTTGGAGIRLETP